MKNRNHIPKGSYHTFCRKMYGIQDSQPRQKYTSQNHHRKNHIKSVQTQRRRKIDEFNTFQQYMNNISNNQQNSLKIKKSPNKYKDNQINDKNQIKTASKTCRMALQQKLLDNRLNLQSQRKNRSKTERFNYNKNSQKSNVKKSQRFDNKNSKNENPMQIIGAFLPFFKIKLDKQRHQNKQAKAFQIDNRKFRLKSLLIEQNKFVSQKWHPLI